MITKKEAEYKDLCLKKENIEIEIQKIKDQLLFSNKISLSERPSRQDVLENLMRFLSYYKHRWIKIEFSYKRFVNKGSSHSFDRISIFLFGKRKLILKNVREVVEQIVNENRWVRKGIRVSLKDEVGLRDFF